LLELLRNEPGAPAFPIVEHGFAQLDRAALTHVRTLRETVGAHIDEHRTVAQLMRDLETADLHGPMTSAAASSPARSSFTPTSSCAGPSCEERAEEASEQPPGNPPHRAAVDALC
jgi:ribosomal protein L12E/L44/L45/RPP1/RPP2